MWFWQNDEYLNSSVLWNLKEENMDEKYKHLPKAICSFLFEYYRNLFTMKK